MRLYKCDGFRLHARHALRHPNGLRLSVHAWSRISHFCRTIVIEPEAFNNGMNPVAVGNRLFQSFQENHADAAADHRTLTQRVERAAVPVRRVDTAQLIPVPSPLGHGDRGRYVVVLVPAGDRGHRAGDRFDEELDTFDGIDELEIKPGTQSGDAMTLRGLGVTHLRGTGRGDLVVHATVQTPTRLDEQQEELLRQLAVLRGEERPEGRLAPANPGLLGKLRDAFKAK